MNIKRVLYYGNCYLACINFIYNYCFKKYTFSKKIAIKRFIFIWCWKQDLNLRPADYETAALPTELFQRIQSTSII